MLPFDRLLVPDMSTARIVAPPPKKARGVVVAPAPAPPPKKACGVVVAPAPKRVTGVVVPSPQRASAALVGLVGKVKAFSPCPPPKPPSIKPRVIRCSSSSSPNEAAAYEPYSESTFEISASKATGYEAYSESTFEISASEAAAYEAS